jgi:hypothetical protein
LKVTNYEEGKVKKGGEKKWKTQKIGKKVIGREKNPSTAIFLPKLAKNDFQDFPSAIKVR